MTKQKQLIRQKLWDPCHICFTKYAIVLNHNELLHKFHHKVASCINKYDSNAKESKGLPT